MNADSAQSWTSKYRPKSIKDMVGNINVIKDAVKYLKCFRSESSPKGDFPRALLISGPSGTGKTEFSKLLSLYRGFIPMEFSAALLRKKQEVEHCIDIYKSDVSKNFSPNHPYVIEALTNLDNCNMVKLGVGVAIIIDELDATSKGYKGLMTALMTILKSIDSHNPRRIIIFTCDDDTLTTKLKTLKNQCYHLSFKKISDREMMKLIDRVCNNEKINLTQNDKASFVKYGNGDCRRLLNGMELCLINNAHEHNPDKLSEMIKTFVNSDDATIQRLKFSTLSSEKVLAKVIQSIITNDKDRDVLDVIPYITGDKYSLGAQIFQTYPTLVRHDINNSDQIDIIAAASVDISDADYFIDQSNALGGFDDSFTYSSYFIIQGVLSPLLKMKSGIPKNFKMDVAGYAKLFGLKKSIDSQFDIKKKIERMVPQLFGKSMEEVRYFSSYIAKMLTDEKYKELGMYFHEHNIELSALDEIEKIRSLKTQQGDFRYLGAELKDIWKAPAKRKFKKEFTSTIPVIQGVKFKDTKTTNKISFFEKFENPKKKLKSQHEKGT